MTEETHHVCVRDEKQTLASSEKVSYGGDGGSLRTIYLKTR